MKLPVVLLSYSISPSDFCPHCENSDTAMSRMLEVILRHIGFPIDPARIELSVTLLTDKEMQILNCEHRGINSPTDVLSFPIFDPPPFESAHAGLPDDIPIMLGDIVISLDTIKKQSIERKITCPERFTECFIHGILHLLGWNHEADMDRDEMERIEDDLFETVLSVFTKSSGT